MNRIVRPLVVTESVFTTIHDQFVSDAGQGIDSKLLPRLVVSYVHQRSPGELEEHDHFMDPVNQRDMNALNWCVRCGHGL